MTSHENPLIPMGAITGKPSKKFLTEVLESFRQKGITQYLIYPRSGCKLEYLSDEWFTMCENIITECKRLGYTSVWLYDEFNWPSGTCGGRLTREHPEFALRQYCVYSDNGVFRSTVRVNPTKTNLLNPDAVDCFISMTHEKYAEHFEQYFGSFIKGIFTDEPGIAYFSKENDDLVRIPWYDGLEADYEKKAGRPLFDDILTGICSGEEFWREKINEILAVRFRDSFSARIAAWCKKHHLLLTGHLMYESDPDAAQCFSGHSMTVLDAFSCPGIDEIFTHTDPEKIEFLTFATVMHAAEHNGNKGALAELFALGPCDLSPAEIRRQIWLAALFGIDHYVMAVSALDVRGNIEKKQWFNPFSKTQAWFDLYDELGAEAAEAAEFALKQREYRVALRYPYRNAPIVPVLRSLCMSQYNVELLLPGESSNADVILNVRNDSSILEERTGKIYLDFPTLEKTLAKADIRSVLIEDADGTPAKNIFVRCFRDRSAVVLDFSGKSRRLILNRNGMRSSVYIPGKGVVRIPGWAVELDRPNILRAIFHSGEFSFTLKEKLSGLVLAFRNSDFIPEVLLDGVPVQCREKCSVLPQGFCEIYLQSHAFSLDAGVHVLKLRGECPDYAYLPSVFLCGEFSEADHELSAYRGFGTDLGGYIGKMVQRASVRIPVDALQVSVDPDEIGCSLKIDGKDLGKRLWTPFTWNIPETLRGKTVEFELTRYLPCNGMFGKNLAGNFQHGWIATDFLPDNSFPPKPFCELIWNDCP